MTLKNDDSTKDINVELSQIRLQLQMLELKARYFDILLDNIPDSIYFKDRDSRFTMVNKAWMNRQGIADINNIIGKTDFDFFPEELAEVFYQDEQRIITSRKPIIGKVDKLEVDGCPVRWTTVSKFPIFNRETGEVIGTFGISHNITALSEVETALAHERDMFHLLLNHSNDAIYFKDLESRFLRISKAHPALQFVESPDDAIGKTDFDYFPYEHAKAAFDDEQQIIKSGKPILGKIERETASGMPEKWVFTSKLPIYDKKGAIIGTFGISRDITELKKYETDLQDAKNELEERVRLRTIDLQNANTDLQKRISQLDFITAASFQMAQCNDIRALACVILDSFSSILGDSTAELYLCRNSGYESLGAKGILLSEELQEISKSLIQQFSTHKVKKPVLIRNWTESLPISDDENELSAYPFYIGVPFIVDNKIIGLLQLFGCEEVESRFEEEMKVILTLASQSAVSLSNAIFYKELNEKAQLKGELEAARTIQQKLTPDHKPKIANVNLKGFYAPAYEVGGDYLDYFKNDLGYWVVVIADVCGKGVPAAMLMTLLRSSFRNEGRTETSAKALLSSVNDSMRVNLDERMFATAICLMFNPEGTVMRYARAGHPHLLHIDGKTGNVKTVTSSGIALGIISDKKMFADTVEELTIPLVNGDRFFIYTDGVTEAFNPQKETYGAARLHQVLSEENGDTPESMIQSIRQDIRVFAQGAPSHDDLTCIAMCVGQTVVG
jgi:PAS domain S-box-containing protein